MSEGLDWGCVPSDFTDLEAKRRTIAEGNWISASDARAIVSQGWQDEGKPTEAIRRRAMQGLVHAKALRWITIEDGQRYEQHDHLVPRRFWDDRSMSQDWSHGDFTSTIFPDETKIEIEAFGVTFERSGIEAMSRASQHARSAPTARHGRPKGSGGFATVDETLVEKMHEYITNHPGTTPHFAAGQFADQAAGNAGLERKQRRLADRYRKAYPA